MSRLNEKDLELLQTGQTVNLSAVENAYYGGEFTTNPNDCVEVLIYDTNDNLLESGIADTTDYSYDYDTGIKLNTGTILRKMGYDRGKYVVKYNFLRKVAGSYETVLVDSDGRIFNGNNYHIMDNGKIMTGETHTDFSRELFLKEYKYFVHEISPSRTEIRLAPQSIDDAQYKNSFFESQITSKRFDIPQGNSVSFYADTLGGSLKGDSKTMILSGDTSLLSKQMIGGYISVNNAFIKEFLPDIKIVTFGRDPWSSDCVKVVEEHYKEKFIQFIQGDSTRTFPLYIDQLKKQTKKKLTAAWVDGGHTLPVCLSDLKCCYESGIDHIFIDDINPKWPWQTIVPLYRFMCDYPYEIIDMSRDKRGIAYLRKSSTRVVSTQQEREQSLRVFNESGV